MSMNRLRHVIQQTTTPLKPSDCSSSNYKYTIDGYADKVLTKEQRNFYEKNGYIIIRNLLPQSDINICNKRFDDLVANPSLRTGEMIVMKDVSIVKSNKTSKNGTKKQEVTKLQDFTYDEIFHKHYLAHPTITAYCQAFLGYDVRSWHQMYISKPTDPGTLSSRHPLHQDIFYFPINNIDRCVAVWTALQPVNRNNGGLCVIPGSHTTPLLPHDYPQWNGPVNHGYIGIPHSEYQKVARKRIHINMNPGDCIFFHPLVIHGSSANLSNRYRRSLCVHFINPVICDHKPLNAPSQIKYVQAEMAMAEKKKKNNPGAMPRLGGGMSVQTYWKLKSRQVVGDCGNWGLTSKEYQIWSKYFYKRQFTQKQIEMNVK